MSAQLGYH